MVSHRSGETEDTFIADLVVGLCTGQVRSSLTRTQIWGGVERTESWVPLSLLPRSESFLSKALLSLCLAPSPCPKHPRGFSVHCKQLWPLFSPSRSRLVPLADPSAWPSTTRSSGKRLPVLSVGLVPRRSPSVLCSTRWGRHPGPSGVRLGPVRHLIALPWSGPAPHDCLVAPGGRGNRSLLDSCNLEFRGATRRP